MAAAPPIAARRDRDGRLRASYRAAGLRDVDAPPTPSLCLSTRRAQKATATCDWPLPRVTAPVHMQARAGGARRCSAVAMAADVVVEALPVPRRLHNDHPHHGRRQWRRALSLLFARLFVLLLFCVFT